MWNEFSQSSEECDSISGLPSHSVMLLLQQFEGGDSWVGRSCSPALGHLGRNGVQGLRNSQRGSLELGLRSVQMRSANPRRHLPCSMFY
jgi:hypothetical protein